MKIIFSFVEITSRSHRSNDSMTKTLVISAIVLVAVIMGISSVAIVLPPATANHGGPGFELLWEIKTCVNRGQASICTAWLDLNDDGD